MTESTSDPGSGNEKAAAGGNRNGLEANQGNISTPDVDEAPDACNDIPHTDGTVHNVAPLVTSSMGNMVSAARFLADLMRLGRHRYGGPQFTFPDDDHGRLHAILALRYAIRCDHTMMEDKRALSWAHLWSSWMLATITPYWDTSTLDPAIWEALREPPSFDGEIDGPLLRITAIERRAAGCSYLMPGVGA